MRNLKKVLSLVLCLAVMLSVMVVGAGAAFSDQDKIENTEAVDACSALNIINGYEDGAFHPERNIKRAEVTKMICVALNGGEEPNTSTNAKPTFTDVRGTIYAWAEGYIESCYAQGIVDGVNGNRFAPASNVTAAQLAKMLLVSLGYNAKTEQFTGNAWETNVNVRAAQKHLYDGLEKMDTSAPVTRDQAAQMVWNAMQAYEVEYKDGVVQDKVVGSTNDKITLLRDRYDAWVYVGTLTEVDSTNITITMNAADRDASDPKPNSDVTSKSFSKIGQDYSSLLGQKVKVLFKDGKSNDVIGIYATSDNTVYKTLMNAVELDGSKIKFNGTSYSVDNTKKIATTFVGIDGTETKDQAIGYFDSTANNNANKTSLNEVTFVDSDANNKIDTAIVLQKKAAEVTNVSSDKITFDGKTYKFADEKIDKDIAQDDWAVMSVDLYNDCKSIVKTGVLTTTVDSYKQKDSDAKIYHQYKLDGTWYNMSNEAYTDAGVSTGDAVKAYVSNGVIVKMKADDGKGGFPSNIAVVVGNGGTSSLDGDQARIRLFDGTVKKVTISDKSKTPDLGKAYKISGSDEAMKFEDVKVNTKYNGYLYVGTDKTADPDNDKIGIATGTAKVDDSAVVILYTQNGRSKQITGKQFNALETSQIANNSTAAKAVFTKDKNGLNRVMMASVLVDNINIAGKSSDNYGYITADASQDKNGNVSYTVWTTDNKYVDVVEEGTYSATDRQKGTLIGYSTIDSNGTISDVDVVANLDTLKNNTAVQGGTTTFNDDGTVYYGGNESEATKMIAVDGVQLNVTADTKVLFVDSDESDDKVGIDYTYGTTTMKKAQKNTDGKTYAPNVFFQVDENGKKDDVDLKVLVLDTTGAFDGFKPDTEDPDAGDQGGTTIKVPANSSAAEIQKALDKATADDTVVVTGRVTGENGRLFNTNKATLVLDNATIPADLEIIGAAEIKGDLTLYGKFTATSVTKGENAAIIDAAATTAVADLDKYLGYVDNVTVNAVTGALTTTDLSGKALTVKTGDVDLSKVTTSDATTKVNVTGEATLGTNVTLKGTWAVGSIAGAATKVTVDGTLTTKGAIPAALTVTKGTAEVGEVKGDVSVAKGATLTAGKIDFTKTITGVVAGATVNLTGTNAISTTGAETLNGDWTIAAPVTLATSNEWTVGANSTVTFNGNLTFTNENTLKATDATSKFIVKDSVTAETNSAETLIQKNDGATALKGKSIAGASFIGAGSANKWKAEKDLDTWA